MGVLPKGTGTVTFQIALMAIKFLIDFQIFNFKIQLIKDNSRVDRVVDLIKVLIISSIQGLLGIISIQIGLRGSHRITSNMEIIITTRVILKIIIIVVLIITHCHQVQVV